MKGLKIFAGLFIFTGYLIAPTQAFPTDTPIRISSGLSEQAIAESLLSKGAIRSKLVYRTYVRLFDSDAHSIAGTYSFDRPLSIIELRERLRSGEYGTKLIKITIPEGSTNAEIARITGIAVPDELQGYLFPDTYYVHEYFTALELIELMQNNFKKNVGNIDRDVLIMASIIEEEASNPLDRRIISGVLWKRLSIGMPLQVDVARVTYERKGLPDGPISNPGLDAIEAAKNPTKSNNLYYLADRIGVTHFSQTFEQHNKNRVKYNI